MAISGQDASIQVRQPAVYCGPSGGVRFKNFGKCQGCLRRYCAMGGNSGGWKFTLLVGFHSKGRCMTPPGRETSSSTRKVARRTSIWRAASPGAPKVSPKGCSMAAILGTPTLAVNSGIMESEIVLNPAASISRCTSPTDQQQTGQTGTSTTASTCSSRSRPIMSDTLRCSKASGRRV